MKRRLWLVVVSGAPVTRQAVWMGEFLYEQTKP